MKTVRMLYGRTGLELRVPERTSVLAGPGAPPVADPAAAVLEALEAPIGSPPLRELLAAKRPQTVAITVSDGTRPVPNRQFLPALLQILHAAGVSDRQIVVVIGTGMHRPSTPEERLRILGPEVLRRVEVIDHDAHDPATLVEISHDPPVSVCRRFAAADFRIVTGFIEPHFMAGFSGGRKGVCPALVDLRTLQRFHGYAALADPRSDSGILDGNPCHAIALEIAHIVGIDFLLNVAITPDHHVAGVYCGDLEAAHLVGCRQVAQWTTAVIDGPFDLVVTSGGGFPLDQSFYQTVKGMCAALPALDSGSTLLQVSSCDDRLGSPSYTEWMLRWGHDWRGFLAHLAAHAEATALDQWELQMHSRVLERIGIDKLWFVSDGVPADVQERIAVTPILGAGSVAERAQGALDGYLAQHPQARVAVIPAGPYTMLGRG